MIKRIQNKYHATDYNFDGTLSILSAVYWVVKILTVAGVLIGCIVFANGNQPGMVFATILCGVVVLIANHLWYSFARVLFEIVKNLRQTRDEIMALRNSSARVPDASRSGGAEDTSSPLRYDPETHEYVKG